MANSGECTNIDEHLWPGKLYMLYNKIDQSIL